MFARLLSIAHTIVAPFNPSPASTTARDIGGFVARPSAERDGDGPEEVRWRRCLFGVFADLPTDVLQQIAHNVPDDDLATWSRVCRGAHGLLRMEYLARRLPEAVPAVITLRMADQAARDIVCFASRPGHWLALLARQLPLLDRSEAAAAFALLLDAAECLPQAQRPRVLQALAVARHECGRNVKTCPIGPTLERRLYRAVLSLQGVDEGRTISAFMAHCSDQFAVAFPPASWDDDVAAMPPAVQPTALAAVQARADRLRCLPHAAFLARLQLAMATPSEDRHLALAALAVPNAYLHPRDAARRFAALLPVIRTLERHQQPLCHAALAYLILPMPANELAVAWHQLFAAMPSLAPFDGAGEVLRALHVGLGFMTPGDGAECRRQLEDYRSANSVHIASLPGTACDIAEPVRRHGWDGRLQVGEVDLRFCLPFHARSAGSERVRAYQAMTQHFPLDATREAGLPMPLRAARVRADVAALDPHYPDKAVGLSLDRPRQQAAWTALLQRIRALPEAVRTAPLSELVRVSRDSTSLFTPQIFMLSLGLPAGQSSPMEQGWNALTDAVRQLPLSRQHELARALLPFFGSMSALRWSATMATQVSLRDRAAMLVTLARESELWPGPTHAALWRTVFEQALTLPVPQRAGVLRLLRQVLPAADGLGWSASPEAALLEAQLRTLPDGV